MTEDKEDRREKKEYKDRVFPCFGHFPLAKWAEYEKEVEDVWAGCRWAKAWSDHEVAKSANKEEAMWNVIMEMKKEFEVLKLAAQGPQEEKKERITLGDE